MTDPTDQEPGEPRDALSHEERAELLRLREEAARGRHKAGTSPRLPGWRPMVAGLLIVVACVLAPLSVVAVWARNQAADTDRYVANVAPLASKPSIQDALANRITNEVFSRLDLEQLLNQVVDALVDQGLPAPAATALRGLEGSIESGARSFVHEQVTAVVTSEEFAQAWTDANRLAHAELVALLEGETDGAVTVQGDAVSIDLWIFIEIVKQRLIDRGFSIAERIPEVHPQFTIVQSGDLTRAQDAFRLLERAAVVLPILVLVLFGLGVYVARAHRRALIWSGLGLTVSMVVLGIALAVARTIYLDRLPESVSAPAAADVFDTLVRFLRLGLRTLLVVGLVVAAGAFFTGSSTTAVRTRAALATGIARLRRSGESAGIRTGPVGAWSYRNRGLLRGGVLAAASLAFVFWERPTGKVVVLLVVLTLIALAIVEFLARPPDDGAHDSGGSSTAAEPV